jgi:hypothetical protein
VNVLNPLLRELRWLVAPLRDRLASPADMMALAVDFGWEAGEPGELDFASLIEAIEALIDLSLEISEITDEAQWIAALGRLGQDADGVIAAVQNLAHAQGAAPFDDPDFWADLASALPAWLLAEYLADRAPASLAVMVLSGVLRREVHDPSGHGRFACRRWTLYPEAVGHFVADPVGAVVGRFGWGTSDSALDDLLATLHLAFGALLPRSRRIAIDPARAGAAGRWAADDEQLARTRALEIDLLRGHIPGSNDYVKLGLALVPVPKAPGLRLTGLAISPAVAGALEESIALAPGYLLTLSVAAESDAAIVVFPDVVTAAVGDAGLRASAELTATGPWRLFGAPESGPFFEIAGFSAQISLDFDESKPVGIVSVSTSASATNPGVLLGIEPGGDSFLAQALPGSGLQVGAALGAIWSSSTGLRFQGGVGLEVDLVVDKTSGPVTLHRLHLCVRAGLDEDPRVEFTLSVGFLLGPFAATVEEIGVRAVLVDRDDPKAQLPVGSSALGFGFRPPTGLGLSLDCEAVRGGGFLSLDHDAGRYAGFLELYTPMFGVSAIGLLNTRIPGRDDGWALFLALCATFNPPIQLGYGFGLGGVGGIFAAHRRLDPVGMSTAVQSGSLDTVLFPRNLSADAAAVFATIEEVFPIAEGQFVFGPMVRLTWGGNLVSVSMGVFVSLPAPFVIAVIGRLQLVLPDPSVDPPVLLLNVDFAGSIDFSAATVAIDASLSDSVLLGRFRLTGGMAFRASFKDDPGFLLAVGGFHPAFQPPDSVGRLQRMGFAFELGEKKNVSIQLGSYFAVTPNTLQFGASFEVVVDLSPLFLSGGASFDALFVWEPFHFVAGIKAWFEVRWHRTALAAIRAELELSGPTPCWRARGEATVEILGIDNSFPFDAEFGRKSFPAAERAHPRALLVEALANRDNWEPAAARPSLVRLVGAPASGEGVLWVDPDGELAFRQRVVPLGVPLRQLGPMPVDEAGPFAVAIHLGTGAAEVVQRTLDEQFPPSTVRRMSEAELLSAPSFERMAAGVAVAAGWRSGRQRDQKVGFEELGGLWPEGEAPSAALGRHRRPADLLRPARAPKLVVAERRWSVEAGLQGATPSSWLVAANHAVEACPRLLPWHALHFEVG